MNLSLDFIFFLNYLILTSMTLVYSREQIKSILQTFINKFEDESFIEKLKSLAPDQNLIDKYIYDFQSEVFKNNGIDPTAGFNDMRKINSVYGNDNEIVTLLANAAMKEDSAISKALGQTMDEVQFDPEYIAQMKKKFNEDPETAKQQMMMFETLAKDPQALAQFKDQLESLKDKNPDALKQFQQMIAFMSLFQTSTDNDLPKTQPPTSEDMEED